MMGHSKLYIVFIIYILTSVCLIQKSIFLNIKENIFVDFFLVLYIT